MKYIYTWNENTSMYSVRVATKEEQKKINQAINLLNQCKQDYKSIIDDAYRYYKGDIDRFIDDEAYYYVQNLNKNLEKVNELTKGLIQFATGNYYFYLW